MNKVILGLGIIFLIVGVIFAVFEVAGIFVSPFNNPFSKTYDLEQGALVPITFLVVGSIFVFLGAKKN